MITFISPAKGFEEKKTDDTYTDIKTTLPEFTDCSKEIVNVLKKLSACDIAKLMKINPELAELNYRRFSDFRFDIDSTPAIFHYSGMQYKNIDVRSMNREDLDFLSENVRILSGLYGVLRPFDSICPYRLEMLTKLSVSGSKNLYDFWGDRLFKSLISNGEDTLLNLASEEYSKCISKYVTPDIRYVTCTFKVRKGDSLKTLSTASKKARGLMVRHIVKNRITDYNVLKDFSEDGYVFSRELSSEESGNINFVFIKE